MKKKEKDPKIHMFANYCAAFKLMLKLFPEKFAGTLSLTIFGNVINFFSFTYILSFVVNWLADRQACFCAYDVCRRNDDSSDNNFNARKCFLYLYTSYFGSKVRFKSKPHAV